MEQARPGAERTLGSVATVPAPPQAVWDLLSDPDRFTEWADGTLEVIRADRPLRIGAGYEERVRVAGPLTGRVRWTVVEHEPPHRATHRGEGIALAAALDFFMRLEPVENATEVTVGLRYRPGMGPIGALAERLYLRRSLQASLDRTARNIARLAQSELAAVPGAPAG